MVAGVSISADLTDEAWLEALRTLGDEHGSFADLGPDHAAVFIEQSHKVLFVSFETVFGIRSGSETGLPLAFDVCESRGWSHLTVIAQRQNWFRDQHIIGFFDRLIDYGFSDQFEKIIFYGAGMCGYAAAAYSVSAPGSQVILISPQATLDRKLTAWDDRFPSSRRLDFGERYSYAPELLDAAESALIIHDPEEIEDAMHASLFRGDHIVHQRYRRGSAGAIESDLRSLSLITQIAEAAASGEMTQTKVASLLRSRRRHVPYLRALLSRVLAEDRPELTAMLCRAVLKEQSLPRFQHQLEKAEIQLGLRQPEPPSDVSEADARDEA